MRIYTPIKKIQILFVNNRFKFPTSSFKKSIITENARNHPYPPLPCKLCRTPSCGLYALVRGSPSNSMAHAHIW